MCDGSRRVPPACPGCRRLAALGGRGRARQAASPATFRAVVGTRGSRQQPRPSCARRAGTSGSDLRRDIREAVLDGNISRAVELLGVSAPGLLKQRPELEFRLWQQQALDCISRLEWDAALTVVLERLQPLARAVPSLCAQLEDTMTLFAFSEPAFAPDACFLEPTRKASAGVSEGVAAAHASDGAPEVAEGAATLASCPPASAAVSDDDDPLSGQHLLSDAHRAITAAAVNAAVLEHRSESSTSRLDLLLADMAVAEEQLEGEHLSSFPRMRGRPAAKGGMAEGSWSSAERLAQAEVDASAVLAHLVRGDVADDG